MAGPLAHQDVGRRRVRPPAVAGMFYPQDPAELRQMIQAMLAAAAYDKAPPSRPTGPKVIIAPHAGYVYSGPIAASAYRRLRQGRDVIRRIVLMGPAHRVRFGGLATSSADAFATPLGEVPLDREAIERALTLAQVGLYDDAHAAEHSLEAHLPWLQCVLGSFTLAPFALGDVYWEDVAELIELLWGDDATRFVISSDLSHYHPYAQARVNDRQTSDVIEAMDVRRPLEPEQACGCTAINAMLVAAQHRGLRARTVDLRNSGDTAGPRDRVVGYGAYVFE